MSLPFFIKHIYNNASEEVIRRGRKIHIAAGIDVLDHNPVLESITLRMKDDMYHSWYKVKVERYNHPHTINIRCTCPYNLTKVCRHKAAALLYLQEMNEQGLLNSRHIQYDQKHTLARIKTIDLKAIRILAGNEIFEEAENLLRTTPANIIHAANERVEAELTDNGVEYEVKIKRNDERFFETSCTCTETEHPLCRHKTVLFLQLLNSHGAHYFDSIRNYERDKERLLAMYGYRLTDNLEGKFEFVYKDNKPFLRVLDPSIRKINIAASTPAQNVESLARSQKINEEKQPKDPKRLGLVFKENRVTYPFFELHIVAGEPSGDGGIAGRLEKLDLSRYIDLPQLEESDTGLLQLVRKMGDPEVNKYLNRNSPFSGFWENIVHTNGNDLPEETRELIDEYIFPKLKVLSEEYSSSPAWLLPAGQRFITESLTNLLIHLPLLKPRLNAVLGKGEVTIKGQVEFDDEWIDFDKNEWESPVAFLYKGKIGFWESVGFIKVFNRYHKPVNVKQQNWQEFAEQELLPYSTWVDMEFSGSLTEEIRDAEPEMSVQLIEKGDFLVFVPQFSYNGVLAPSHFMEEVYTFHEGKVQILYRNIKAEKQFFDRMRQLHHNFIVNSHSNELALKGSDVLRNNWFFNFLDTMKKEGISIYGFEMLRNFRFNTTKPTTHLRVSSGLDWFDAEVDLSFGEQKVRLSEVKKALAKKQQVVPLQDGTLGVLPEDWLKKYSLLFKVGEMHGEQIRLNRYQYSVIDELYENRNDETIQLEFEGQMDRLRQFKRIKKVMPPAHLREILRPYQVSGFHWLNFLKDNNCGGILADDMGLGKTLQALTMLEHYQLVNGRLKALVVCPTTLLYNWENEIRKFTPGLSYQIHHGPQRNRKIEDAAQLQVTITTYGTLRSDVLLLKEIPFDYIVLDESQAIKNPNSKVSRAACLLNGLYRICMSGTPLQNNTFDIYAQMNFLNPGLLGSQDFFRNEFATPIDKFGEHEQKQHLRKLIYPFMLRRTKEQVASDLPEKTETILYCEMGHEQRTVYNAFRNEYRNKVLGLIDEQGMERSQLTILQGLMKLRQICDSPSILNEPEKYPNHSIKLEELTREITENISNHKALVFSQFLGMLALIREKFEQLKVPYVYFDGSTSINDRQKAIDKFQNDPECKVFLISLKAGGVGLNLTAADYVYIVDPWWNPAVEQQAIDRTHRIGQTRNIFAYRMICRDTVEDKIIQLQEKKRILAKELIADDSGFVKKLTRDDIAYLFS